jgi:hypothetical protein
VDLRSRPVLHRRRCRGRPGSSRRRARAGHTLRPQQRCGRSDGTTARTSPDVLAGGQGWGCPRRGRGRTRCARLRWRSHGHGPFQHLGVRIQRDDSINQHCELDSEHARAATHVKQLPGTVKTELASQHRRKLRRVRRPASQVVRGHRLRAQGRDGLLLASRRTLRAKSAGAPQRQSWWHRPSKGRLCGDDRRPVGLAATSI